MRKVQKWKVGISFSFYYLVDVEAPNEEIAIVMARQELDRYEEDYSTGSNECVTGVFINDRECQDYSTYVPDTLPPIHLDEC